MKYHVLSGNVAEIWQKIKIQLSFLTDILTRAGENDSKSWFIVFTHLTWPIPITISCRYFMYSSCNLPVYLSYLKFLDWLLVAKITAEWIQLHVKSVQSTLSHLISTSVPRATCTPFLFIFNTQAWLIFCLPVFPTVSKKRGKCKLDGTKDREAALPSFL